jgi:trehalose 6-phosphate synthase
MRRRINELVGNVNGQYGQLGMPVIDYLYRNLDIDELIAMYRCADVMLVTPLRDGMNLIAKEFVASRIDNRGTLVLSEFTGAAKELRGAIQVNPHDIDGLMASIEEALSMSPAAATRRMRSMRDTIRRHTVHDWAKSFLGAVNQ